MSRTCGPGSAPIRTPGEPTHIRGVGETSFILNFSLIRIALSLREAAQGGGESRADSLTSGSDSVTSNFMILAIYFYLSEAQFPVSCAVTVILSTHLWVAARLKSDANGDGRELSSAQHQRLIIRNAMISEKILFYPKTVLFRLFTWVGGRLGRLEGERTSRVLDR